MQDSFQQTDEAKVAEMLKMIERANTIEVFGVGGSFPICTDFARKLTFLGKKPMHDLIGMNKRQQLRIWTDRI